MVKNSVTLPENYVPTLEVDLKKNKKLALLVNGLALLIAVILVVIAQPFVSITTLYDMSDGLGIYFLRFVLLIVGAVAYIILHELVHGIFMKYYSGVKPRYGFTGLYAYAGSDAYFNKKSYIVIALAPVVIWGAVLLVLCLVVPTRWFWVVYFIQIMNLSGAGGDFYVTWRFSKLPEDILVKDIGVSMTVYEAR